MNTSRRRSTGKVVRLVPAAVLSTRSAPSLPRMPRQFAGSAPGGSIAMPESGGAAAANALASAEVDPSTGILRAAYSFYLGTPRGNVKFSLGLGYTSAAGVGVAGYGWDLQTEEIHRISPSGHLGAPTYVTPGDAAMPWDRFSFGDTQLVPICISSPPSRRAAR